MIRTCSQCKRPASGGAGERRRRVYMVVGCCSRKLRLEGTRPIPPRARRDGPWPGAEVRHPRSRSAAGAAGRARMVSSVMTTFLTSVRSGMSYMTSSSASSTIVRSARAPVLRSSARSAAASSASGREDQLDLVERQELLELAGDRVLGLGQHAHQVVLGERRQADDDRQAADELGDQPVLQQVLGHQLVQQPPRAPRATAGLRSEADRPLARRAPRRSSRAPRRRRRR